MTTLTQSLAQRDAGMSQAANHAEAVSPGWSDHAFAFLIQYAMAHDTFTSEQVTDASLSDATFEPPASPRAWGSVYRRALKEGVIVMVGTGRALRRKASICPLWGSLVVQ